MRPREAAEQIGIWADRPRNASRDLGTVIPATQLDCFDGVRTHEEGIRLLRRERAALKLQALHRGGREGFEIAFGPGAQPNLASTFGSSAFSTMAGV